jgi:hypothetical protein
MSGTTQNGTDEEYNPGERGIISPTTEDWYIPVVGVRVSDLTIAIPLLGVPALLGLFIGKIEVLLLTMPLGVLATGLIIKASPEAMPARLWAINYAKHILRPNTLFSASSSATTESRNEGGLKNYVGFQSSARTQDLTGVKYGWPGAQAIMTKKGTMEGVLEIKAPNMDLSDGSEWRANQESAKEGADEVLSEHPLFKIYVTTKQFDVSQITEILDERLKSPDVANRPILKAAVEELRDHRPAEMQKRGTQEVRYFAVVTVEPFEATTQYTGANTPVENVSETPVIGSIIRWGATKLGYQGEQTSKPDPENPEVREEMLEMLNHRLREVRTSVFGKMDGYEGRRLSTVECMILAARVWRGHDESYDQFESLVRQHPMPNSKTLFTSDEEDDNG